MNNVGCYMKGLLHNAKFDQTISIDFLKASENIEQV